MPHIVNYPLNSGTRTFNIWEMKQYMKLSISPYFTVSFRIQLCPPQLSSFNPISNEQSCLLLPITIGLYLFLSQAPLERHTFPWFQCLARADRWIALSCLDSRIMSHAHMLTSLTCSESFLTSHSTSSSKWSLFRYFILSCRDFMSSF